MMFSCPVTHFCSKFYHELETGVWTQANKAVRLVIVIFMPLKQFVDIWLIREVHSIVLMQSRNCTEHP